MNVNININILVPPTVVLAAAPASPRPPDPKPYMIRVVLIKGFQNQIGFAIIRARGEEWWLLEGHAKLSKAGPSAARRKAVGRQTDRGFRIDQMGPRWQTNH